jgi:hypothetical protein
LGYGFIFAPPGEVGNDIKFIDISRLAVEIIAITAVAALVSVITSKRDD